MPLCAFDAALARAWLMEPAALAQLFDIADRHGDPEALAARLGQPLDNTRAVEVRDGVAIVPVIGPIFRYANLFTELSGATSTQVLATDIRAALDDRGVRALVLDINSPGGEATGINELAQMIATARAEKPVVAYVGGMAASAAYWLASAAGDVVIDPTALLGSIGVVMARQLSGADPKGRRTLEFVSSNAPLKRADPESDAGRAEMQRLVDDLEAVFIGAVAGYRRTTPARVTTDFGRGGLLVGKAAITAGMADRLGSLEAVIAGPFERAGYRPFGTSRARTATTRGTPSVNISTTAELQAALAAGADPAALEIATVDVEALKATVIAAERARINALLAIKAEGFEREIAAAIADGSSPEVTALAILQTQRDRGITLEDIRRDGLAQRITHAPAPSGDLSSRNAVLNSWDSAFDKAK
ncbi:peptidase S49-like protein [Plasticicumulans lactativorans]|uniref:Peptidase S49-like protein n=1 Tax=Plasticicumulans lactativorans TaxID=1133106 RepID=A0A4R2L6P3_9GAMM|nr:S49 family peptidase [Plasticicumulans lactativorans]TCO83078.1 peptidase S49-like protein [Plasticicumulans lactativorans]